MLNSNGGIIIWGGPKENKDGFEKHLTYVSYEYTKDQFIAKIANSVTPSPNNIKFQPIQSEKGFIYIIEVKKGIARPYQFQNIYYMRMDGATKASPHHYIEALFKQIQFPKLNISAEIRESLYFPEEDIINLSVNIFVNNLTPIQNERNLSILIVSNNQYLIKDIETEKTCYYGVSVIRIYNNLKLERDIQSNYDFEFQVLVGGALSPMISSKFGFNYGPNRKIIKHLISENKYLYE